MVFFTNLKFLNYVDVFFLKQFRDEVWIFIKKKQMYKVMLTDNEELVFLTPPPKLVDNDIPSKKPLSRSASKQDKLSLSKVRFFFPQNKLWKLFLFIIWIYFIGACVFQYNIPL